MTVDPKFWNDLADKYAAKPVDNPDAFDKKTDITRALMRPSDVVLEIGCGTGSLALRLASTARQIHGLDLSSEMLRIARGKAAAAGADNLSFHVGAFDDGFDLFGPNSLDGLLAFSILHLLEDRKAALRRIYDLLKPGGYFVSSTVCLGASWIPYRPMIWTMRLFGKAPYVEILSKATLEADMREVGFEAIEAPDVGAQSIVSFLVARKPR